MKGKTHQWKRVLIRDICESIIDCVNKTAPTVESPTPYKMIRTTNVKKGCIDLTNVRYVTKETYDKWTRRAIPRKGDVILTREAPLGEVGMLRANNTIFLGQRLVQYRADPEKLDNRFLLYSFQAYDLQAQIKSFGSGATVEHMRVPDAEKLTILLPDLLLQKKIAYILSSYDDLIENNTRRIEILEQMAKLIYEEWFVKFRFPGHENVKMVPSDLGEIPDGWEVREVCEILKRLKAGKKFTQDNVFDEGLIPVIDQSEKELLGFHNDIADHNASLKNPIMIFGDHTCKIKILIEPFSVGPNVIPFRSENYPEIFVFFLIKNLVQTKEYKRHWNELQAKRVVLPDVPLSRDFVNVVNPLFKQMTLLEHKNQNLRKTRDLLLPKLISGEIDVSDLDIRIRNEFQES